ncbi:hypothetical protein HK101_003879 [Irineochytrium annulatum]|nr:hypothetical protein HK101_003879 [Irineochytrium annulatum]
MPFDYSTLKAIKVELQGPVAVITLDRPKEQNSFDFWMAKSLVTAYEEMDLDDRIRVIVVTGQGQFFCAGADLRGSEGQEGPFAPSAESARAIAHRDGGGLVSLAVHRCRKVTIAAINGHMVGVGATMTLGMDIRIAYANAKVGFVFVRRGIAPEACSSYFLPKLIGHSRAMELVLTGRVQPASHPSLNLLFSQVLPRAEDVLPEALKLAREIASNTSAVAAATTKGLMWHAGNSAEEAHLLDSQVIFALSNGVDAHEGVKSFLEKRKVDFKGTVTNDMPPFWPWWNPVDVRTPLGRNNSKL